MLLSATMPKEILEVTEHIMKNPVQILVRKEELTLDGIKQFYINVVEEKYKLDTLLDLYRSIHLCQVVIFVNTVRKASMLYEELIKEKFKVTCIVSDF